MIIKAEKENLAQAAALAAELWPHHTPAELLAEFKSLPPEESALFLAVEDGTPAGFAQCQLRHDYVEGTAHSPVGYLEGIYVRAGHRGKGLACGLLTACETWARERGCREFASDCELDNTDSLNFHLASGFAEANRVICFVKKLT